MFVMGVAAFIVDAALEALVASCHWQPMYYGNLVSPQFPPNQQVQGGKGLSEVLRSVLRTLLGGGGSTIGIGHWQPCDVAPLTSSSSSSSIGRRRRQNGAGSSSRGAQPEVATQVELEQRRAESE